MAIPVDMVKILILHKVTEVIPEAIHHKEDTNKVNDLVITTTIIITNITTGMNTSIMAMAVINQVLPIGTLEVNPASTREDNPTNLTLLNGRSIQIDRTILNARLNPTTRNRSIQVL